MIITDIKEIYERIGIGDTIGYYSDGRRLEKTFKEGIVSLVVKCYKQCGFYKECYKIQITGDCDIPLCRSYNGGSSTSIKYIIKKEDFISEEEFTV